MTYPAVLPGRIGIVIQMRIADKYVLFEFERHRRILCSVYHGTVANNRIYGMFQRCGSPLQVNLCCVGARKNVSIIGDRAVRTVDLSDTNPPMYSRPTELDTPVEIFEK